ncbi:histone H2B/H2A fusion protein [Brazilian marseillevirus]|uniref:histone H2B/H2A fusion protein n=1 Tax=Brazilian marseillevirus TaxID=1813599 RepID=UPI0007835019|nr:histone H2B/H2A fusion protein [Brazilian marseillevirus]AMQ10945.1 histone H2B/H2A fusion protein [Brazilian marseillevirus]
MASKATKEKSKKSEDASARKKPSKDINFKVGIRRVLAQVHPDQSIRAEALEELDNIAIFLGKAISKDAAILVGTESKTINGRAISSAAVALLGGELGKHAHAQAGKAITASQAGDGKGESRSIKARLQLSVARSERLIREHACAYRVSATAGIALAAVLEYIIAEIIELAGNASRDSKKVRIAVKHIQLAVQNDAELHHLLGKGIFSGGGVQLVGPQYFSVKPPKAKKATSPKKKPASPKKKPASPKKKVQKRKSSGKDEEGRSPSF